MRIPGLSLRPFAEPFQTACETLAGYMNPGAWYPALRSESASTSGYVTPAEYPIDQYETARNDWSELEGLAGTHRAELAARTLDRDALAAECQTALQWRDRAIAGAGLSFLGLGMGFGMLAQPFMLLAAIPLLMGTSVAFCHSASMAQHYGRRAGALAVDVARVEGEIKSLRRHLAQEQQAVARLRQRLATLAPPAP
jgi:hypothetical protein